MNGDGIDEVIAHPTHTVSPDGEASYIIGATGNGPVFVYKKQPEGWSQIADLSGEHYWIDDRRFNHWPIIITDWDMGGNERGRLVLAYDGSSYHAVHRYSINVGEE